jgi:hypothetical protein
MTEVMMYVLFLLSPGYSVIEVQRDFYTSSQCEEAKRNFAAATPSNLSQGYRPYAYCVPMRVSKKKE